ncbi:MAG: DUF2075 domain-containing protein [Aeriscardovia sp.]|nr:DUF2075 domain-containing protein [Aeriscardovia sp.]
MAAGLVIKKIEDNSLSLKNLEQEVLSADTEAEQNILFNFPTVYIHNWKDTDKYEVYVGETNDILSRTRQHYQQIGEDGAWQNSLRNNRASLYIIGHKHFNKSLTLDVENRLIQYLLSADSVKRVHNLRGNPQNQYYPSEELDQIFRNLWRNLRKDNKELFPAESQIKDSAIFKASPLHKLTKEQIIARDLIVEKVLQALERNENGKLVFIDGEAGTGKTVLNSSTFYELFCRAEEENREIKCVLLVNHEEQVSVYKQIAEKLGLTEKYGDVVSRPTHFINNHSETNKVDVAFVDEAHLLWTQGTLGYGGHNQLKDVMERARVTVVMYDENQVLSTQQYWEDNSLQKYRNQAIKDGAYLELKTQLRMSAGESVLQWIDDFTKEGIVGPIPKNLGNYSIQIFDHPEDLDKAIIQKAKKQDTALSRLIATYDWPYNSKADEGKRLGKYWEVLINKWHKPWNRELERTLDKKEKKRIKGLAWAEQPQTINEVGSTFTIQGFDLNYAGVILGPSVKYRDGKIVFDPSKSYNEKAIQNRTLSNGKKQKFGEQLLQHEVRVLMTRGVNGLYIYACDDELRKVLQQASK